MTPQHSWWYHNKQNLSIGDRPVLFRSVPLIDTTRAGSVVYDSAALLVVSQQTELIHRGQTGAFPLCPLIDTTRAGSVVYDSAALIVVSQQGSER